MFLHVAERYFPLTLIVEVSQVVMKSPSVGAPRAGMASATRAATLSLILQMFGRRIWGVAISQGEQYGAIGFELCTMPIDSIL